MAVDIPVATNAQGEIIFQYNAPRPSIPPGGSHCSDIRVHFKLDNVEFLLTAWLGYESRTPVLPLHSDVIVLQNVSAGNHILTLQPEGRPGGCNYGNLYAWDGTLLLFE